MRETRSETKNACPQNNHLYLPKVSSQLPLQLYPHHENQLIQIDTWGVHTTDSDALDPIGSQNQAQNEPPHPLT